jgi:hypothetical protein
MSGGSCMALTKAENPAEENRFGSPLNKREEK